MVEEEGAGAARKAGEDGALAGAPPSARAVEEREAEVCVYVCASIGACVCLCECSCVCVCLCKYSGLVDEFGVKLISYELGGTPPPSHPPVSTFPAPPSTFFPLPSPLPPPFSMSAHRCGKSSRLRMPMLTGFLLRRRWHR